MIKETYTTPKSISDVLNELKKIRTNMTWADIAYLIDDVEHLVVEDKAFQSKYAEMELELAKLEDERDELKVIKEELTYALDHKDDEILY